MRCVLAKQIYGNAFKSRLKCPNSLSGCRSEAGRLFQILGPATDNWINFVNVRTTSGTYHHMLKQHDEKSQWLL